MKQIVDKRIKEVLITEEEINARIHDAAEWINTNYANKSPIMIGILKGCIPFLGKLITHVNVDLRLDFMAISSFQGNIVAQTEPEIITDLKFSVQGEDIILVEDIVDTGRTIKKVINLLLARGANSVKVLTLVDKKEGRKVDLVADFVCFDIPLVFIVGFGLDYKELMRNLPYIGILKEEVYLQDITEQAKTNEETGDN
ncbi:hypoxanthine phosphoribosyltransferase [Ureaplasma miroungigenitalium]|uniref:Hypoxanthine phosphoribosyltransferase n=1 Tax=Ureaplasma miroungigenitalium TaxID=1042321 RepID=A0ABT3BN86_9BACT|nr:hypoxanthine phosphoribosyltransferase [Ureaplasma miroungigenitalium]MCV3728686.1 hypoxanthine phosphoribosyltransferase [Ureaplasma miroungigenitalium]MCV3734377.1 hypoxanthine phosphoribosyltransferase [Ureaplasma miroungigenitalium]